jgi:hypothetical protein
METEPELVAVLLARLRFVRDLRRVVEDELDREEHAVLALLREAGVPWQRAVDEVYGTSVQAVRQLHARLGARVGEGVRARGGRAPRR